MSARRFEGKTALVTGGASGIGKAVAVRLGAEGANVVVSDLAPEAARKVADEIIAAGGRALAVAGDVGKSDDVKAAVEAAVSGFGALQLAVNNAGIGGPHAPTGEYPLDGWDKVIAINLSGTFYGMRFQIPAMKAAGGGAIVNMASILGQVGFRGSPAYVAAKHGVIGLTRCAALEHAHDRIRINAIGPGFIRTPLVETSLDAAALTALEGMHALGRLGEPDEVAALTVWLASDQASFVTGAYYPVDGGYLAQ